MPEVAVDRTQAKASTRRVSVAPPHDCCASALDKLSTRRMLASRTEVFYPADSGSIADIPHSQSILGRREQPVPVAEEQSGRTSEHSHFACRAPPWAGRGHNLIDGEQTNAVKHVVIILANPAESDVFWAMPAKRVIPVIGSGSERQLGRPVFGFPDIVIKPRLEVPDFWNAERVPDPSVVDDMQAVWADQETAVKIVQVVCRLVLAALIAGRASIGKQLPRHRVRGVESILGSPMDCDTPTPMLHEGEGERDGLGMVVTAIQSQRRV